MIDGQMKDLFFQTSWLVCIEITDIIRIYREFVDRKDNSVPRVTAWHHEALPSDAKQ